MYKFEIHRLCRDEKIKDKIEKETQKYKLPSTQLYTGIDLYSFINKVIKKSEADYVLLCHEDVIVPINIGERVDECIEKMNETYGEKNWGLVGNAGIEFLSRQIIRYLRDPHSNIVPPNTKQPRVVTFVDGNTLLLNMRAIHDQRVSLPEYLNGYHLYDFVLLSELYKAGLICAVDSTLYVIHNSPGNQKGFDRGVKNKAFQKYFKENYINNNLLTINGKVDFVNDLSYLKKDQKDNRKDYYGMIEKVVLENPRIKMKRIDLNVVIRTQLNRDNYLRRLLDSIFVAQGMNENINFLVSLAIDRVPEDIVESTIKKLRDKYPTLKITHSVNNDISHQYPRVAVIRNHLKQLKSTENSYVWFVDDDDFIFPVDLKYLPLILNQESVLVGNSVVFNEKWELQESYPSSSQVNFTRDIANDYFSGPAGNNHVPFSAALYPTKVIKSIFDTYQMLGDYYEDYAIILLAQKDCDLDYYPIILSGVSFHGDNTVLEKDRIHWDYSYASFISEIVQTGLVKDWISRFAGDGEIILERLENIIQMRYIYQEYQVFQAIKTRKFWRVLEFIRINRLRIQKYVQFYKKHGLMMSFRRLSEKLRH